MGDNERTTLVMVDASAKVRSMVERANAAVDVAFLKGSSTSLQRYTYVQEEYVAPAVKAAEQYYSTCAFQFGPFASPFIFFLPLADPLVKSAHALRDRYESAVSGALEDEIAAQGALIKAALEKQRAAEASFAIQSLTYIEKRALDGLNLSRDAGAWVERNLGITMVTLQVVAGEVGETSRVAIESGGEVLEVGINEAGETIQTGIKTAGDTVTGLGKAAGDTLIKGLLIFAAIALAALLALIVIVPHVLRAVAVV